MSHSRPVRTCVGCRERATKSDLVRVVAEAHETHHTVVPDTPGRTQAGRGAYVHPVPACVDLAERRRAFPRALRLEGTFDLSSLRSWIEAHNQLSTREAGAETSTKAEQRLMTSR